MLSQLYIENIAVIEKAEIRFQPGFNALTGETGAGKSMIIDAINAILGERMSKGLVRTGARTAFVSALFTDAGEEAARKLRELGYELQEEDNSILIQREISQEGKGSCRICGRPATVSTLKELGPFLIHIHGQHESYHLLSPELHMEYLDRMGGLEPLLSQYRRAFSEVKRIRREINHCNMDEEQKARRMDLLRYQISELEDAQIRVGEQEELFRKKAVYANSKRIAASVSEAKGILDGSEDNPGVLAALSAAADSLMDAQRYLPALRPLAERLRSAAYDLEDCSGELRSATAQLEYDPEDQERVEERLDTLYRLGLKYGESEEAMLGYLEKCRAELRGIELSDENIERLTEEFAVARDESIRLAKELSAKRAETASDFTARVKAELRFLDMPNADFQVEQERCPLNDYGCDRIQFLISANAGEPPRPIAKIASGGELSRIMLAIKTVLAGRDETDTLIFDEVDTGISGSAARKVGLKLREVSEHRQVICVTHLAQIACLAGCHFFIQKQVRDNRTFTQVTRLDFEGRKRELARIMGGAEITPLMLENAQEMLKTAGIFPETT
ncbi:MAG TPA: DNA repair protein RecN [Candidatus Gallacutalibacter pullicola]|uniref:DNA repair protein RecN n=1 Tax=Candidatus Gallacutalibacter pullicola TaxID=2840830 RepID=A0A9D1DPB1_9FIRM|nr:DNA repair protein RecN [Candidatus Gallacutalibacter pullicola]